MVVAMRMSCMKIYAITMRQNGFCQNFAHCLSVCIVISISTLWLQYINCNNTLLFKPEFSERIAMKLRAKNSYLQIIEKKNSSLCAVSKIHIHYQTLPKT